MFCQLGYIRFERTSYFTGMEAGKSFGFAEHARVEGKPRLQAIGDSLDTLTLDMRLHVLWCDPVAMAEELVKVSARKEAMALTLGDGNYLGRFVVTEINASHQHLSPEGRVLWMDFRLSLKEWVDDDPLASAKRQRVAEAPARKTGANQPLSKTQKGTPAFSSAKETSKEDYRVDQIVRKA